MVRPEYRYPVLQEFLAELVYETRHLNKRKLDKRYEDLLEIILGPHTQKNSRKEYKDDTELLAFAATLFKSGEFGKSEACLEAAKFHQIKGYKIGSGWPEKIDHASRQAINSEKIRLLEKFKKPEDHMQKHAVRVMEGIFYEKTHHEEAAFVKSLISDWCRRYGVK